METTTLKLVTIIAESVLEQRQGRLGRLQWSSGNLTGRLASRPTAPRDSSEACSINLRKRSSLSRIVFCVENFSMARTR